MAAIAHNPAFAKKVGIPQSVGKDFNQADKGRKFRSGGMAKKDMESKSETRKEMYSVHGVPYTIAIEDLPETQAQPVKEVEAIRGSDACSAARKRVVRSAQNFMASTASASPRFQRVRRSL